MRESCVVEEDEWLLFTAVVGEFKQCHTSLENLMLWANHSQFLYGVGLALRSYIYVVTVAIFPGYITEDVHSQLLKDWYPILVITGYNVFDLVGECLTAVYLLENVNIAVGSCIARLLFFLLFLGCLHGPKFFRTEIPVTILTCLFGLTNGYLTTLLMILAPKIVKLQHAETAGIVSVLFLVFGLAVGSIIAWFWVI